MTDPVVVIGGGLAGLSCARALARAGTPVQVIDAGAELGGRAATSEHSGYLLNRGAHALYPSSERLLRAAGVRPAGGHPKPAVWSMLVGGELLPAPFGPASLLSSRALTRGERARFARLIGQVATARTEPLRGRDAAWWVDEHSPTPMIRGLLTALMRLSTYCGQLTDLPAEIGVGMLGEATRRPVRYLDDGWRQISGALAALARQDGAQIESATRALSIDASGGGPTVIAGGGRAIAASAVVLAGLSPARAARLLAAAGGALPAVVTPARTLRAACLDVALDHLADGATPFVLGIDEPLYLSTHSHYARIAPPAGAVVQLLRYSDGSEGSAQQQLERLEALLDQAQPGWREHVVHRRFAPRMVVTHHLPSPEHGYRGRPAACDSGMPAVFLAGDWVGERGWLASASLHSGNEAAAAVLASRAGARTRAPATAAAA